MGNVHAAAESQSSVTPVQPVRIPNLAGLDKRQKIDLLRRNIASIAAPSVEIEQANESYLTPPEGLVSVLRGGLPRGAISSITHPGAVLSALIAAATESGSHAAIVGMPDLGLLSVAEQGGALDRIICVPDPGENALEVISLLADGVDLLVVELPQPPSPSRLRRIQTRLRSNGTALVAVGQAWPNSVLRIASRVERVSGLGNGRGRIKGIQYRVHAEHGRYPAQTSLWWVGEVPAQTASGISSARDLSAETSVAPFPTSKAVC